MAKWGEQDPRWLVAEIGTTNPNSWHWEEKNLLSWSKQRLAELLAEFREPVNSGKGSVKLTGLKECTGEAYLTRRKGNKVFSAFELKLKIEWQGVWEPDAKEAKGTISVSEFASFHDEDEYLVEAALEPGDGGGGAEAHADLMLAAVRGAAVKEAFGSRVLARYVADLASQKLTRTPSQAQLQQQQQEEGGERQQQQEEGEGQQQGEREGAGEQQLQQGEESEQQQGS